MKGLRLQSYAKINLGLNILGKREDGFHEIETIFQQIDLKDEIEFKTKEEPVIEFFCDSLEIPTGNDNLCVHAAKLLKETMGVQKGVEIVLKKTIPIGAGLGGGSSNGAVVLLGLNKLWNLKLKPKQLQNLACQLGSDVPFFIQGGTALACGRGEILRTLNFKNDFTILIVFPGFQISTKSIYRQMNLNLTIKKKSIKLRYFEGQDLKDVGICNLLKNDLEKIVFKKYPILAAIKEQLYSKNAIYASMSGSGSALFGIFREKSEALEVKKLYINHYPIFITQPIKWGYTQLN